MASTLRSQSLRSQPFTDATTLRGLEMLAKCLLITCETPGDLEARLECQLGVWLATTGMGRIEWGASHGVGCQLGAVAGVSHGICSCLRLPRVLAWNRAYTTDPQAVIARALGREDGDAAQGMADLIERQGFAIATSRCRGSPRAFPGDRRWSA